MYQMCIFLCTYSYYFFQLHINSVICLILVLFIQCSEISASLLIPLVFSQRPSSWSPPSSCPSPEWLLPRLLQSVVWDILLLFPILESFSGSCAFLFLDYLLISEEYSSSSFLRKREWEVNYLRSRISEKVFIVFKWFSTLVAYWNYMGEP